MVFGWTRKPREDKVVEPLEVRLKDPRPETSPEGVSQNTNHILERKLYEFEILRAKYDKKHKREMVKVRIISGPVDYELNGRTHNFDEKWKGREFKMPFSDYQVIVGNVEPRIGQRVSYDANKLIIYCKSQLKIERRERLEEVVALDLVEQDSKEGSSVIDLTGFVEPE